MRESSGASPTRHKNPTTGLLSLFEIRPLLIFAGCVALFQLANAAMLPLAASMMTLRSAKIRHHSGRHLDRRASTHRRCSFPLGRAQGQRWAAAPCLFFASPPWRSAACCSRPLSTLSPDGGAAARRRVRRRRSRCWFP